MYLFNSLAMRIEDDEVFAVISQPQSVKGEGIDASKSIAEQIEAGDLEVVDQYQLARHKGILDGDVLFASEEECTEYFRKFFYGQAGE